MILLHGGPPPAAAGSAAPPAPVLHMHSVHEYNLRDIGPWDIEDFGLRHVCQKTFPAPDAQKTFPSHRFPFLADVPLLRK
jgi:hypothetical protein